VYEDEDDYTRIVPRTCLGCFLDQVFDNEEVCYGCRTASDADPIEPVVEAVELQLPDLVTPSDFIERVRWWQFWRWHLAFTDDYHLSRAAEIVSRR